MPRIAYVNGQYVPHNDASVHIEDRGFQFADSVYEAVALMGGVLLDVTGHIDRLERSLRELRIPMPVNRRTLVLVMRELARRNRIQNGAVYIQVSRGVAPRDFAFPKIPVVPTLVMTLRPASYDVAACKATAKAVVTVPDIRWKRRDIKTTGLLGQVLARQYAVEKGAAEAWMVDDKGMVTEAASANAWIVTSRNELITRPAGNTILKGVTRSAIQALCKEAGIKIVERPFSVKEAYKAREAFSSSAVALIAAVGSIDGHKIGNGRMGPVTEMLFDFYMAYAADLQTHQFSWHER